MRRRCFFSCLRSPQRWAGCCSCSCSRSRTNRAWVNTSLDEGDVVRIMRRTVDLLAQVPYCEAISEQLRSHARQALKAINRFPVAEAEDLVPASAALNPATERAA